MKVETADNKEDFTSRNFIVQDIFLYSGEMEDSLVFRESGGHHD